MTVLQDVVVVLGVAVIACVGIELMSRWSIRTRGLYFVLPPGLRLRMRPDPDVFPQLQRSTRFDVNSVGERGSEVPSGPGVYRVLVAGGSQPEGFLLDQDTTWPGALQRLLDQPDARRTLGASRVHVGSIARSGVGSEALDLILQRVLPRYPRLALVIVMVGATDVLRWLEQGAPAEIAPVQTSDVFRCHPESRFGWRLQTLASVELLRRARRQWLKPLQRHDHAGRWIGKVRAARARATDVRTSVPDPAPMLERFTLHFNRLLTRAEAHADRVLVVRQPWFDKHFTPEEAACMWHGGAGQVWRDEVGTYYSFDVCSRLMATLDRHAATLIEERGAEQLDLMPILDRNLETYYDAFHVTPKGAHDVARAVAAALLSTPAGRPSVERTRETGIREALKTVASLEL
jgi:lysophospholipase L1-like esterase